MPDIKSVPSSGKISLTVIVMSSLAKSPTKVKIRPSVKCWLGRLGVGWAGWGTLQTSGPFLRTPFSHWFLLSYLICYISDNCIALCWLEVFHQIFWEVEFGIEIIGSTALRWSRDCHGQSPRWSFSSEWWKCVKTIRRLGHSLCQICTWTCFFPSG